MTRLIPIGEPRQCTRCKEVFPNTTEHFYRAKKGDDLHLLSRCINCMNELQADWRKKNPSKEHEKAKRHYHKDLEKSRAQSRARNKHWRQRRKQGMSVS